VGLVLRLLSGLSSGRAHERPAVTFDQARAEFEEAWRVFLSNRTEADFQKWRHQRDWTERKYAMWKAGEKAPVGWVVYLDRVRLGGVYGTKEAAFEAAMVAASFAVRDGEGVHVSVPSDAKLRDVEPSERWPTEWNAFLKR
jgi:hypothetical protein